MNTKVLIAGGAVGLSVVVPVVTLSNSSGSSQQAQAVKQDLGLVSSQNSENIGNTESSALSSPLSDSKDLKPLTEGSGVLGKEVSRPESSSQKLTDKVVNPEKSLTVRESVSPDNSTRTSQLDKSGSQTLPKTKEQHLKTPILTQAKSSVPKPKYDECKEIAKDELIGSLVACYDNKNETKVNFSFVAFLSTLSRKRIKGSAQQVGKLEVKPLYMATEVIGRSGPRVWLDFPKNVPSEKRNFSFQGKSALIDKDKCSVEWKIDDATKEKLDWSVKCV